MSSKDATSDELNDESLALLLDEVSAMASTGRPLIAGLPGFDDRATRKLHRAASAVRASLDQGKSAAESVALLSTTYNAPIRVAMDVMTRTGSSEPIGEAVRLIRETNEQRRLTRLAWINPILNVVVAATITFFVMPWILVTLSQAELIKTAFSPTAIEIGYAFAQHFLLAAIATIAVVGLFCGLLYWAGSQSRHTVGTPSDYSIFCNWLAIQVDPINAKGSQPIGNEGLARIVESASAVVGSRFAESWDMVVQRLHAGSKSLDSLSLPSTTPPPVATCVAELAIGNRDAQSVALDLRHLSLLYRQQSRRHRVWWTSLLPQWISWTLMIIMMVVILRTILIPLFNVVREVVP